MPAPAPIIDVKELARGFGTVKPGTGYSRIMAGGQTLAYAKRGTVTVPAKLVKRAPKKLGSFAVEKNGRWASARADTAAARRILEYVVAQQKEAE